MAEVTETVLPGIGVRHEFDTSDGVRIGVLTHRGGRRELLVYDAQDPDSVGSQVRLDHDETRTLAELLGASSVSEKAAAMERIEGLAIDWVRVDPEQVGNSGKAIAELQMRTNTGVSIIAVLRGDTPVPAPGPDEVLLPGDTVVVTGTPEGIEKARQLLTKQ